jgi:uncharacterized protein
MQNQTYKTMILGASPNPSRVSYVAASKLDRDGIEWIPVGIKTGELFGKPILDLRKFPQVDNLDTITLYLNPLNQKEWYDYIISLDPRRVIFNPGTENPELITLLKNEGIIPEIACTLVMLSMGVYQDS